MGVEIYLLLRLRSLVKSSLSERFPCVLLLAEELLLIVDSFVVRLHCVALL
jgi:hypothetical protein